MRATHFQLYLLVFQRYVHLFFIRFQPVALCKALQIKLVKILLPFQVDSCQCAVQGTLLMKPPFISSVCDLIKCLDNLAMVMKTLDISLLVGGCL